MTFFEADKFGRTVSVGDVVTQGISDLRRHSRLLHVEISASRLDGLAFACSAHNYLSSASHRTRLFAHLKLTS
jgi:hypothetical protein